MRIWGVNELKCICCNGGIEVHIAILEMIYGDNNRLKGPITAHNLDIYYIEHTHTHTHTHTRSGPALLWARHTENAL